MGRFTEELRALVTLALPLASAQAGQAAMGLVDTAIVGRVSAQAQAAAGLGNAIVFTSCFFGMGVMFALDPLVSQAVGAGDRQRAHHWYLQGQWVAVGASILVLAPLLAMRWLLPACGIDAVLAHEANRYIVYRLPGVLGVLLFCGARAYLQGLGLTRPIFIAMVAANIVNALLDVGLVFGHFGLPQMGLVGAGIATSLATGFQWLVLLWAIALAKPAGLATWLAPPDSAALRVFWSTGLPIGSHLLAEGGVFVVAGIIATRFGETAGAAHTLVLQWSSLTFCVCAGIGSAAATRVGWAVGATNLPAARLAGWVALAASTAFMSIFSVAFVCMPGVFASAMTSKAPVFTLAIPLLAVCAVYQVADGAQAVAGGALRGANDTRTTLWANLIGHWCIGLPVAWWLGVTRGWGVTGVWWGLTVGLWCVALILVARFRWAGARGALATRAYAS